jgi:hypothetical protein
MRKAAVFVGETAYDKTAVAPLISASQLRFEKYGRKSRRELFLGEMEVIVPWAQSPALVKPHYPKAGNGRRPEGLPD